MRASNLLPSWSYILVAAVVASLAMGCSPGAEDDDTLGDDTGGDDDAADDVSDDDDTHDPAPVGEFDLADAADAVVYGGREEARAGIRVRPAGDVNGDGIGDFVISAQQFGGGEYDERGMVYLVHGPFPERRVLTTFDALIMGEDSDGLFGAYGLAGGGDTDGDGYDDLPIGGQYVDGDGGLDCGAAYLVRGGPR